MMTELAVIESIQPDNVRLVMDNQTEIWLDRSTCPDQIEVGQVVQLKKYEDQWHIVKILQGETQWRLEESRRMREKLKKKS